MLLRLVTVFFYLSLGSIYAQPTFNKNKTLGLELIKVVKSLSNASEDTSGAADLISQNADLNIQDELGNTAAHYAVKGLLPKILMLLIDNDANLNLQNNLGNTALVQIFDIRLQGFGTPFYISDAVRQLNDVFIASYNRCMELSLNADLVDQNQRSLTMRAAIDGRTEHLESLINCKPNLDLQDKNGDSTAILLATLRSFEYQAKLRILLRNGADMLILNNAGDSILSAVPNNVSKEIYEIIQEIKGADYALQVSLTNSAIYTARDDNGALSLKLPTNDPQDCELLENLASSISDWKLRVNPADASILAPECICHDDICSLSLESIAPKIMLDWEGKNPLNNGPNCFNTVLNGNGNESDLRYTGEAEMINFTKSNFCRERDINEDAKSGDIIVIYYEPKSFGDLLPAAGPIHAFTYLSDQYSFSKDGFDRDIPYTLTSNNEVFRKYNVIPELRKVNSEFMDGYTFPDFSSLRINQGYNFSIFYDCDTNKDIETLIPENIDRQLSNIQEKLLKFEKEIVKAISVAKASSSDLAAWKTTLDGIAFDLRSFRSVTGSDKKAFDLLADKLTTFEDSLTILTKPK